MKIKKLQWKAVNYSRLHSYIVSPETVLSRVFLYEISRTFYTDSNGTIMPEYIVAVYYNFEKKILGQVSTIAKCKQIAQSHFEVVLTLAFDE